MPYSYDKYVLNRKEKALFYCAYGCVSIMVALLFYRNALFAVVLIPLSGRVRTYVEEVLNDRRRRKLLTEFKDMLFMVATSIGAGRSLKDAIHEAIPGIEGIYGRESVLVPELQQIYQRMHAGNEKDTDVLLDFAERTEMEDIIDFVTIYTTCKVTGASLIIALNKAASVIIDKMSIENEIRELVRRKETEGLAIFVMPVVVLLFLNLTAPDYIGPLYDTITGRIIMTIVVVSNVGIYYMISRITKVEV
ncbi:MAG: hypothetical protein IJH91_03260 [Mogibacterium sp.]|nr:hypothetical protein [Mogibacterium sp.]